MRLIPMNFSLFFFIFRLFPVQLTILVSSSSLLVCSSVITFSLPPIARTTICWLASKKRKLIFWQWKKVSPTRARRKSQGLKFEQLGWVAWSRHETVSTFGIPSIQAETIEKQFEIHNSLFIQHVVILCASMSQHKNFNYWDFSKEFEFRARLIKVKIVNESNHRAFWNAIYMMSMCNLHDVWLKVFQGGSVDCCFP